LAETWCLNFDPFATQKADQEQLETLCKAAETFNEIRNMPPEQLLRLISDPVARIRNNRNSIDPE